MPDTLPQTFSTWLQLGQKLEAEARIADAIAAYDRAIALLRSNPSAREIADRRALGIAWMNRGNALQKLAPPAPRAETIRAYDEAIALFESLPYQTEPAFCHHLGAAWLNRGHALLVVQDLSGAAHAFEQSVALLQSLPLEADPYFRLNLAGAWTNLAHATFVTAPERALAAARAALAALDSADRSHEAFAAMSLRARRALVMAIGETLSRGTGSSPAVASGAGRVSPVDSNAPDHGRDARATPVALASEATDAIEAGLALTREFEARGTVTLRPLAARLFRLGVQIYRVHQPHFLAEFILEIFSTPALAADPEFRATADAALAETLSDLQRPQLFVAGTPDSDRRREVAQSLRAAQDRLRDPAFHVIRENGSSPPARRA